MIVYKFNKNGELLRTYKSSNECAMLNGTYKKLVCDYIKQQKIFKGTFYFSFKKSINPDSFSISKSKTEVRHDISTNKIISDYRDELSKYFSENYPAIPEHKRISFIREFNLSTKYLSCY